MSEAAIDLASADAYFAPGQHSAAEVWLKFKAQHRAGAVAEAARMLSLDLGRELRAGPREDGTPFREDYAAYEQALWLLLGSPHGDAANGDALAILQGQRDEGNADGTRRRERWSREALRWLGWGGVVMVRS